VNDKDGPDHHLVIVESGRRASSTITCSIRRQITSCAPRASQVAAQAAPILDCPLEVQRRERGP
jgi:hypothetical protein